MTAAEWTTDSKVICCLEMRDDHSFILKCSEETWNKDELQNTKKVLSAKTASYLNLRKNLNEDNTIIWLLRAQNPDNGWVYKNVGVCYSIRSFNNEINGHLHRLIDEPGKKVKAGYYYNLWNETRCIEFLELDVAKVCKLITESKEWSTEDPYIKSLFAVVDDKANPSVQLIARKLRAGYIEGRIASELHMRRDEGGIWECSSLGIDGNIYDYYK